MPKTEIEAEKKTRKSHGDGVLPALAKVGREVAKAQDEARAAVAKFQADNKRVAGCYGAAFGGAQRQLLAKSPVLSEDDKKFLKQLGHI